jgi:hypothetical protein
MFFERLVDFINAVSSVAVEVICFLTNIFEVLWFVSCVAMPFVPLRIWVYGFESCYEDVYVRKQAMKATLDAFMTRAQAEKMNELEREEEEILMAHAGFDTWMRYRKGVITSKHPTWSPVDN